MSINPNIPANFTPTLGQYKPLSPFRFWCQKVLPLVYDDSLSYYELLNKVVNYLNMAMEDVDTLHGDVDALYQSYVQLQGYVNTYFSSLDVQEEINNKLDEMATDGSLTTLIAPLMPELISEWLTEHITPTTPAVDNTLSISGAAGDAKKTGDEISFVKDKIIRTADIHYCKILNKSEYELKSGLRPNTDGSWSSYVNGTYSTLLVPCNRWDSFYQTNPRNSTGFILDSELKMIGTANFSHEKPYTVSNENAVYIGFSVKTNNDSSILWFTDFDFTDLPSIPTSDFGKMLYFFGDNVLEYEKMFNNYNLQNNVITDSSIYNNLLSNLPRNTYSNINVSDFNDVPNLDSNENNVIVITFSSYGGHEDLSGIRTQFLISPLFGKLFVRRTVDNTYTSWTNIENSFNELNLQNNIITDASIYNNLLSNLPRNTYSHVIVSDFNDVPVLDSNENNVIVITFSSYGGHDELLGVRTQLLISPIFGRIFTRRTVNGTYTEWTSSYFESMPQYYAFGDSLTWGAVWTENDGEATINRAQWKNRIPTRIAHAIGADFTFENMGVGGMAFVPHTGTYATSFYDYIVSHSLTNPKLITMSGGRNDAPTPLGSSDNLTQGTICYEVDRILNYLTNTYKKAQIVWIQVTPSTSDNNSVFTRITDGGWSLNSFENEVKAICEKYCVPFISWKECTYMKHWADFTGAGGNTAHPNNDESYIQMGNYLAGKVSSYYKG